MDSGPPLEKYCPIAEKQIILNRYGEGDAWTIHTDNFRCPYKYAYENRMVFCALDRLAPCQVFDNFIYEISAQEFEPKYKKK